MIRASYTSFCGTMIVLPPPVSLYGVPAASSLSMTAEASAGARLVYSGAYAGVDAQRNTMNAAMQQREAADDGDGLLAGGEGRERLLQRLQPAGDLVPHQIDIRMISWKASRALLRTAVVSWVATVASVAVIV